MHPQLETLLEIQDLKTQRIDLMEGGSEHALQQEVFGIKVEEAVAALDLKIDEMEASLEPQIRARYQRLAGRRARAVVPVIRGTCYGCFVAIPTAVASDAERNQELQFCDNCGRFLYMVD